MMLAKIKMVAEGREGSREIEKILKNCMISGL